MDEAIELRRQNHVGDRDSHDQRENQARTPRETRLRFLSPRRDNPEAGLSFDLALDGFHRVLLGFAVGDVGEYRNRAPAIEARDELWGRVRLDVDGLGERDQLATVRGCFSIRLVQILGRCGADPVR